MGYKNIDIFFVLVLYKCKLSKADTFITLAASLKQYQYKFNLLVYDNSPLVSNEQYAFDNITISYINDTKNGGVSKAYNIGAAMAKNAGIKWLLLLDQDTFFPINTIEKYLSAINQYPDNKIFVPLMIAGDESIISPCVFKYGRGFKGKDVKPGQYSFNGKSIINCGLCVDVDAFYKAKGYNENIQLDFSDHDFIKRFKKLSADKFVMIDLLVSHQLSVKSRNSMQSDRIRFSYYLQGINYMATNITEVFAYNIHGFLRALKLSVQHKSPVFIGVILKNLFIKQK